MKLSEVRKGDHAVVNANNDFMMCGDEKHLISEEVELVKVTKAGKVQVKHKNKSYSIPAKNIDRLNDHRFYDELKNIVKKNLIEKEVKNKRSIK